MYRIIETISDKYDLTDEEKGGLTNFIENKFEEVEAQNIPAYDMNVWENILFLARINGAASVINSKLCRNYPIEFVCPQKVSIEIYDSFAGHIPIIYAENISDFESLVTNIVHKGIRPDNLEKTGAAFVSGKTLRFIILSSKPYSNVTSDELGIDENDWAEKSMIIRRSHECTHFFTKERYGMANNMLHDEIMADFIGLYDAFGFYKAEWFLRFMGIIEGSGKRLDVYINDMPKNLKASMKELLTEAAKGLEKWSHSNHFKNITNAERIDEMCKMGISGMIKIKATPHKDRLTSLY